MKGRAWSWIWPHRRTHVVTRVAHQFPDREGAAGATRVAASERGGGALHDRVLYRDARQLQRPQALVSLQRRPRGGPVIEAPRAQEPPVNARTRSDELSRPRTRLPQRSSKSQDRLKSATTCLRGGEPSVFTSAGVRHDVVHIEQGSRDDGKHSLTCQHVTDASGL